MSTESQTNEEPARTKSEAEITAMVERNRDMDLTVFGGNVGVFNSGAGFNLAQRMANALSHSTMIPKDYQGNPGNVLIAIDTASRLGLGVLALMSHCDIIYGRPALRGKLYIGIINSCGKFSRLKWQTQGEADVGGGVPSPDYGYRAYATELATGEVLYGPWITWEMVEREGWNKDKDNRNGGGVTKSKWNTLRELMFHYRSAAFWGNLHAPDVTLGLAVEGETEDYIDADYTVVSGNGPAKKTTSKRGSAAARANETLQAELDRDHETSRQSAQQPSDDKSPAEEAPVGQSIDPDFNVE